MPFSILLPSVVLNCFRWVTFWYHHRVSVTCTLNVNSANRITHTTVWIFLFTAQFSTIEMNFIVPLMWHFLATVYKAQSHDRDPIRIQNVHSAILNKQTTRVSAQLKWKPIRFAPRPRRKAEAGKPHNLFTPTSICMCVPQGKNKSLPGDGSPPPPAPINPREFTTAVRLLLSSFSSKSSNTLSMSTRSIARCSYPLLPGMLPKSA